MSQSDKMNEASFSSLMKGFIGKKEKEKKQRMQESLHLRNIAFINKVIKEVDDDGDDEGGWREKMAQQASTTRKDMPGISTSPRGEMQNIMSKELEGQPAVAQEPSASKLHASWMEDDDTQPGVSGKRKGGTGKMGVTWGEKNKLFKAWINTRSSEEKEKILHRFASMSPEEKNNFKKNIIDKEMERYGLKQKSGGTSNLNLSRMTGEKAETADKITKKILKTYLSQRASRGRVDPSLALFVQDAFPNLKSDVLSRVGDLPPDSPEIDEIIDSVVPIGTLKINKRFWNSQLDAYGNKTVDQIEASAGQAGGVTLGKLGKYGAQAVGPIVDIGRERIVDLPVDKIPVADFIKLYSEFRANPEEIVRANLAASRSGSRGELQGNPNVITSKEPLIGSEHEGTFVPGRYIAKLSKTGKLSDKEWLEVAAAAIDPENKNPGAKHIFDKLVDTMARKTDAAPNEIIRILTLAIERTQSGAFKRMKSLDEIKDKIHPEEYDLAKSVIEKLNPETIVGAKHVRDINPPLQDLSREEAQKVEPGGDISALNKFFKKQAAEKRAAEEEEQRKAEELKSRRMPPEEIEASRRSDIGRRRAAQFASVERARKLKSASPEEIQKFGSNEEALKARTARAIALRNQKQFQEENPGFAMFMKKVRATFSPKAAEEVIRQKAQEMNIKVPAEVPSEYEFSSPDIEAVHRGGLNPERGLFGGSSGGILKTKRDPLAVSGTPEEIEGRELGAKYRRRLAGVGPEKEIPRDIQLGHIKKLMKAAAAKMKELGMKPEQKSVVQAVLASIERDKGSKLSSLIPMLKAMLTKKRSGEEQPHASSLDTGKLHGRAATYQQAGKEGKPASTEVNPNPERAELSRAHKKPEEKEDKPKKQSPPEHKGGEVPGKTFPIGKKSKKVKYEKGKVPVRESYSLKEMVLGADGKQIKHTEKDKPWEEAKPNKKYTAPKMTLKEIFEDKK